MIPRPYLLHLGHSADPLDLKTSRGLAQFAADKCIGEFRPDGDGISVGLPPMTLEQAVAAGARTLVLGVAHPGGGLGEELARDALAAIRLGLNVAAGLHDRLRDRTELMQAAWAAGVTLYDVRDPPLELSVGNGRSRAGRRLLTVGTDCSVGKMYSAIAIERTMREHGIRADFRATGQTGILIAGSGIPIDAVVADFVSGAVEALSPARGDDGWDVIEGQGSLFHPSFAGVSTALLHGAQPDALVLCHEVGRPHLRGLPSYPLPDLSVCLNANLAVARLTNPNVRAVGVCLNTARMAEDEARAACSEVGDWLGLPATDPVRFGVESIVEEVERCVEASRLSTIAIL